jgi:hypothetical protein
MAALDKPRVKVDSGCFVSGVFVSPGSKQGCPVWTMVTRDVLAKTIKVEQFLIPKPGKNGNRTVMNSNQKVSYHVDVRLKSYIGELRIHPKWDEEPNLASEKNLYLCLAHHVVDGLISSYREAHSDMNEGSGVELSVGDEALEELRVQADLPALEGDAEDGTSDDGDRADGDSNGPNGTGGQQEYRDADDDQTMHGGNEGAESASAQIKQELAVF